MLSITLTFILVLVGFFTDSLPDVSFNMVDLMIINSLRKLFRKDMVEIPSTQSGRIRRARRQEALGRALLALSDQQLITGLAMLVAAYLRYDISGYSASLVLYMSLLSADSHLATMSILRRYGA